MIHESNRRSTLRPTNVLRPTLSDDRHPWWKQAAMWSAPSYHETCTCGLRLGAMTEDIAKLMLAKHQETHAA